MPMPVSAIVIVLAASSTLIRIASSASGSSDIVVGEHLELDAVERVRGVRDQLAQEDLAVGVERVRQDVQELLDLGAEGKWGGRCWLNVLGLGGHTIASGLS